MAQFDLASFGGGFALGNVTGINIGICLAANVMDEKPKKVYKSGYKKGKKKVEDTKEKICKHHKKHHKHHHKPETEEVSKEAGEAATVTVEVVETPKKSDKKHHHSKSSKTSEPEIVETLTGEVVEEEKKIPNFVKK